MPDRETVATMFKRLSTLDRSDLVDLWETKVKVPPFKGVRKPTLVRALLYHEQCRQTRDIKETTKRKLLNLATRRIDERPSSCSDPKSPIARPTVSTTVGTRLVREWNGRTFMVEVREDGFALNGVTYASLSAAACAITGSHWSGPRFFGVAS